MLAPEFETDGFAIVPGVLAPEVVDALARAVDAAGEGPAVLRREGALYGMRDALRGLPEVRDLAGSEALLGLVRPVLGPGAFAVRGLLFDKTPGANWARPLAPGPDDRRQGPRRRPGLRPLDGQGGRAARPAARRGARTDADASASTSTTAAPTGARSASSPARTAAAGSAPRRPGDWLERGRPVACLVPRGGVRDDAPADPPRLLARRRPRAPAGRPPGIRGRAPARRASSGSKVLSRRARARRDEVHQDARDRQRLRLRQQLRPEAAGRPGAAGRRGQRPALRHRLRRPDPDRPLRAGRRPDADVQRRRLRVGDVRQRRPLRRQVRLRPRDRPQGPGDRSRPAAAS